MLKLYRFAESFGRMGYLSGLFVEDDERVKKVIGKRVYFGEVLGKHSEIYFDLEERHFQELTDDQAFIQKFEELNLATGHNPFNYMEKNDED